MYSDKEQQEINQLTERLLGQQNSASGTDEAMALSADLKKVILYHDWRYYVLSEPVISDFEYDTLFKKLKKLEEAYPEIATDDSPTQRVAGGITKDFPPVAHTVPMLSLDNSYSKEDLYNWKTRIERIIPDEKLVFTAEPKFDGSSIALIYENDQLLRVATRGDGQTGEEITNNAKVLRSLPLSANFSAHGIYKAELRGEVLISKERFEQINRQRIEEGLTVLANPRNAASGALRLQDSREVSRRSLEAFIYQMAYAVDKDGKDLFERKIHRHDESLEILYALGFKIPKKETGVFNTIDEVVEFCNEWEAKRDSYPYEIDGMVIKLNEFRQQRESGATSHHPRWAIAYKFKARQATSRLEKIEFQVGRTGAITPVAKVKPVALAGVTISSISLFNEDFIAEKDLRIGDKVLLERAGDVIPYIVKSITDTRDGTEQKVVFPESCPSCQSELVRPEGEAVRRCINALCPAQVVEKLIHFVSKDAMDIRGLGDALIRKFFEMGYLKSIPDIYRLNFDEIKTMEGFGEKSAENLQKAIEGSKKAPLYRLIFGLGIRFVGLRTAKILADEVNTVFDLKEKTDEQLMELEDIGPKVASSIYEFFSVEENTAMLEELQELGLNINADKDKKDTTGLPFSGKSFLFTGTLEAFSRKEAAEIAEEMGGKVISAVSKKLDYLVVGTSPGSKLTKAEKIGTIKILTEDEFKALLSKIKNEQ